MYRQVESLPKESLVVVCVPLPGVGGVLTDSSSQGLFEEERPRRVQGRDPGHPQSQPGHRLTWGHSGDLSLVRSYTDTGLSLVEPMEPNNSGAKV